MLYVQVSNANLDNLVVIIIFDEWVEWEIHHLMLAVDRLLR